MKADAADDKWRDWRAAEHFKNKSYKNKVIVFKGKVSKIRYTYVHILI